jgi:hypothetical protein
MSQVVPREAGRREVVVLERVAALRRDVLVKGAAERDVDDLEAAAEPEQRLPLGDGPAGELQLDSIPRRVEPTRRPRGSSAGS